MNETVKIARDNTPTNMIDGESWGIENAAKRASTVHRVRMMNDRMASA
jgi:hypothetical protein